MTTTSLRLVGLGPDDAAFPAWCAVWAAAEAEARRAARGCELVTWRDRTPDALVTDRAAVLRDLVAEFPGTTRISNCNSEDNAPMVAVNRALGFEPAGQISTWSRRAG